MDKTLQSLLTLAHEGNIERRCAALLVLGALKLEEDNVIKAVNAALEQPQRSSEGLRVTLRRRGTPESKSAIIAATP